MAPCLYPHPPLQNKHYTKAKGEEIAIESLPVPMWHILVAYIFTVLILTKFSASSSKSLWYPIILLIESK